MSDSSPQRLNPSDQIARLVGAAILLVMLDYGRDVLIPIVLAVFLALLLAPLIGRLRRWGMGQVQAVTLSVLLLFVSVSLTAVVLGSQAIRLVGSLPQYESTIRNKLQAIDRLTLGKLDAVVRQADRMAAKLSPPQDAALTAAAAAATPLRVQLEKPHAKPLEIVTRLAETVLPPLERAGIVFIVLIFILLDYDSLRDRMIRLVSGGNLRATTHALADATGRLSRFFVSQVAVNALVAGLVAAGLGLAGLSGALFWGALTGVSRFIPYVGIWLAAGAATLMAAAMSEGWVLMLQTLGVFLFVEIVVAQFFEPRLYGHSTGLSPLSVVISALFWSALWGPAGLILATPLTLCLVVAGRYVPALKFLEILLGDLSALSHAERFYQRALAGDAPELVRGLKLFLKDRPLRQYCDQVLLAAIRIASIDFSEHEITRGEQERMRHSIAVLTGEMSRKRKLRRGGDRASVLAGEPAERRKPHAFRGGVLVTEVGEEVGSLIARVLLNVLHSEQIEARHQARIGPDGLILGESPALVFITCFAPDDHAAELGAVVAGLRHRLPGARLVVMRVLEEVDADFARPGVAECGADAMVHGYGEAVEMCFRELCGVQMAA